MTIRWQRRALHLTVLGTALLLTTACENEPGGDGPAGADRAGLTGADSAERGPGKGRRGPHGKKGKKGKKGMRKDHRKGGGAAALLRHALRDLELKDEQKTEIKTLLDGLRPTDEERTAHKDVQKAIADGVRAGTIDEAAVQEKSKALESQKQASRKRLGEALAKLHGVLTPEQRKSVVDGVRKRADRAAGPPWLDADQPVDPAAQPSDNVPEEAKPEPAKAGKKGKKGKKGRYGRFGRCGMQVQRLELTDEQQEKLDAAWKDLEQERPTPEQRKEKHEARLAQMDKLLDAFGGDSFDAEAALGEPPGDGKTDRVERQLGLLKALLPILTEEQRGSLADMLLKGPTRPGMRGKGGMLDKGGMPGKRGMPPAKGGMR